MAPSRHAAVAENEAGLSVPWGAVVSAGCGGKGNYATCATYVYEDQNLHEYTSMRICIYKYTGNYTAWKNNPVTIMGAVGFWGKEGEPW